LRGGSFSYFGYFLHASYRLDYSPASEHGYIGFRVSEVPEPATATLLLLGFSGLLWRRKR